MVILTTNQLVLSKSLHVPGRIAGVRRVVMQGVATVRINVSSNGWHTKEAVGLPGAIHLAAAPMTQLLTISITKIDSKKYTGRICP